MAKQSITAPSYATNNVQNLDIAQENKELITQAVFDKASVDIKAYENQLIAELNGNDGSKKIGHNSTNITSNNVSDALEEIITAINDVTLGDIPNGSITDAKLNSDIKVGSLATLTTTEKTNVVGAINEIDLLLSDTITDLSTVETDLNITRIAKLATGSVNAFAVDTSGIFDLTLDGNILTFIPNLTTTSTTPTVAVDGQTAKSIKKANDIGNFVDLEVGDIKKNVPCQLVWDSVSDFFIFAPKRGSNIKSIQRGVASVNSTAINIPLTSVDVTKSIVIIQVNSNGENNTQFVAISAKLTTATNLLLSRNATSGTALVSWQVIEFNNVKSKQTGTKITNLSSDTATITSVSTAKSILISTYITAVNVASISACFNNTVLTNSTTITFNTYNITNTTTYEWQVIEFN